MEIENEIESRVDSLVLPGDIVGKITDLKTRLGPGLMQNQDNIVATKCGVLRNPQPKYFWVENRQKRYVPAVEDMVIGVVIDKLGDHFKVDIGAAAPATLNYMSFEGATKKNRPNLQVGSLLYARVVLANKDMDPELSCMSVRSKAEGFGELYGGYMFKCSLSHAYALLDDESPILSLLGKAVPFEVAVGMNGKVWVNSGENHHTILLANAIEKSENMKLNQVQALVSKISSHFETK